MLSNRTTPEALSLLCQRRDHAWCVGCGCACHRNSAGTEGRLTCLGRVAITSPAPHGCSRLRLQDGFRPLRARYTKGVKRRQIASAGLQDVPCGVSLPKSYPFSTFPLCCKHNPFCCWGGHGDPLTLVLAPVLQAPTGLVDSRFAVPHDSCGPQRYRHWKPGILADLEKRIGPNVFNVGCAAGSTPVGNTDPRGPELNRHAVRQSLPPLRQAPAVDLVREGERQRRLSRKDVTARRDGHFSSRLIRPINRLRVLQVHSLQHQARRTRRVNLRRADVLVTQQFLDYPDVPRQFVDACRERVAKRVRVHHERHKGTFCVLDGFNKDSARPTNSDRTRGS